MGLREWSSKRKIKDPVRGVFRRTGWYDKHDRLGDTWLTGAITVQGMPAFAAEARADGQGKWTQTDQLPVIVDRSNPNNFAILWEEIVLQGPGAQAQQSAQQEAARLNAGGAPAPASPFGNPAGVTSTNADLAEMQSWAREMLQDFGSGAMTAGSVTSQVFVNGRPVAPGTESPMVADALRRAAQALGQVGNAVPGGVAAGGVPAATTIPATATVRSMTDVQSESPGGAADVSFDVALPEGNRPVFQRITFATPQNRADVQPGMTLPVLFDPATGRLRPDPSRPT